VIPARIDLANAGEAVTMLEGLVRLNQQQLRAKPLPPLYGSGIRYKREAGTGERWQTIRQLYASRRGDCEDLAAALCAQRREAGQACRVDLVRTGNTNVNIRTMIRQGSAIAVVTIPTTQGPVKLRSVIPVELVSRLLQRRMAGEGETIGWGFFKKVAKKAKKFAKKIAKSRVLKSALKIAMLLDQGRKLVSKAKSGNRKARALVSQIKAQAAFKRRPTPWNFQAAKKLQAYNSRRLGRPVGDPIFSTRFDAAVRACAT